MATYAVAIVQETRFGPEIKEYLERIDATLVPYAGRFRVHGRPYVPLEGNWTGDLIVIEFPSTEQAQYWYESQAYAKIRPLRTKNTEGVVFLVQGVPASHRATDLLSWQAK